MIEERSGEWRERGRGREREREIHVAPICNPTYYKTITINRGVQLIYSTSLISEDHQLCFFLLSSCVIVFCKNSRQSMFVYVYFCMLYWIVTGTFWIGFIAQSWIES